MTPPSQKLRKLKLERSSTNKTTEDTEHATLNHENEILMSKLTKHQNGIQSLMNHCLHSSNLLNENVQRSHALIENEFRHIIKAINNQKQIVLNKLNEIKLQKLEQITQSTVWLNECRQIASNTMNQCMHLMKSPNNTQKMRSLVNNLLSHQQLPQRMNVDSHINISFDHKPNISAVCTFVFFLFKSS